ncbi:MAG: 3-deoxy-manno-octulosonate cytidylyltransferase [Weeksellaceae bacterium]|nr:3-deoxy-manno-octulosonate cytidylyltransferase [Weeksellaceae bacterium]
MQFIAVIPARFASTRLPAKLLEKIGSRTVLEHTWRSVEHIEWLDKVIIATDHKRIEEEAKRFGANVVMTSVNHQSGSDRIAEVIKNISCDVIINIQADEPFTSSQDLEILRDIFTRDSLHEVDVASLMSRIVEEDLIANPNIVKVVTNLQQDALYFSRSPIPYKRSDVQVDYYRHIGIYAYRKQSLMRFVSMPPSITEKAEMLEQLRFLENSMRIRMGVTQHAAIAIDTAEDLERAREFYQKNSEQNL